ncbi:MAG: oligosaccharide flippase family protein, partial [Promethearchaeota archaeon]
MINGEPFDTKNENFDFGGISNEANRGIKWNSFSLIYSAFIRFLMMMILARLFTPEQYGIMGYILLIIGFGMMFSDVGVSGAVIHYQQISKKQLSTLFWFTIIIGILIFIVLNITTPIISSFFKEPELNPLIRLTSINFLIIPFGQQSETLLRKELKFKSISIIEISNSTILVIISLTLAYYNYGVISVIIGHILKDLIKSFFMLFAGLKIWRPRFGFTISGIRKFLSFGFYQMGER